MSGAGSQGASARDTGWHPSDGCGWASAGIALVPESQSVSSLGMSLHSTVLTQCIYYGGTEFSGKGFLFRQVRSGGYGDASLTYEDLVNATCLLQASQTSSSFTSWLLTAVATLCLLKQEMSVC